MADGPQPAGKTSARRDWGRPLRYLWRLPLFVAHVLLALPITLITIRYGKNSRDRRGRRRDQAAIAAWSGRMLWIFGIRIIRFGQPLADPVLVLANHVSWVDIEVIHSQLAAGFVAKAEIARWPVVGYMAKAGGSVFHHRGSGASQQQVIEAMSERLRAGGSVAIFPEGRTGPGVPVLPFHGRLLQAAVSADTPIQPVAIRYQRNGRYHHGLARQPGEPFMVNVLRSLGEPASEVEVHFLEPIERNGMGRRDMARQAHAAITAIVERDA